MNLIYISLLASCFACSCADFVYRNFDDITGLDFAGEAFSSTCEEGAKNPALLYQPKHGRSDPTDSDTVPHLITEERTEAETQRQFTDDPSTSARIKVETATIGHRDFFVPAPKGCAGRIRLTSSRPRRSGAVYRQQRVPVLGGFETQFEFQVSDHSRSCTEVRDRNFNIYHHKSCKVHGGDGFAFVMHSDPNDTRALGGLGSSMGYGGLRNSLAVEFDTWFNAEDGDLFDDHVSVQTMGIAANSPSAAAQLVVAKPHPIADGQYHTVKIRYYNYLKYDLVPYFTGADHLDQFLKDNGEGRRVGTFVVYVDDMVTPLLAFPINLSTVLKLTQGEAVVGFTAATGRSWEKHDITAWYLCEKPGCPRSHFDESWRDEVDYHQVNEDNLNEMYRPQPP